MHPPFGNIASQVTRIDDNGMNIERIGKVSYDLQICLLLAGGLN